jgi:hypothetical protein
MTAGARLPYSTLSFAPQNRFGPFHEVVTLGKKCATNKVEWIPISVGTGSS